MNDQTQTPATTPTGAASALTVELARRIETLPKWAQRHIQNLQCEIARRDSLVTAHSLLCEQKREWFTLRGSKRSGSMKLWLLNHDQPHAVCSLGPDDVLLVARANYK